MSGLCVSARGRWAGWVPRSTSKRMKDLAGVTYAGSSDRLSAIGRVYRYRILNRRAPAALERGRVWHVAPPLDLKAMREGARHLVGHHDFTTFRAADCQSDSPLKTLDELDVSRVGEEVHVVAAARSFLHNQVRSMVGSLKRVGEGGWTADDLALALAARDRARCAALAPPHGLYFTAVIYD